MQKDRDTLIEQSQSAVTAQFLMYLLRLYSTSADIKVSQSSRVFYASKWL